MAKQLVSAMTGEFDPAQYKDEYREALEKIIEAKVEGRETVEVEEPEETGKLVDLMAALEASVSAAKAARESAPRSPCPWPRPARRRPPEAGRLQGARQGVGGRGEGQAGDSEAQDRLSGVRRPSTRAANVSAAGRRACGHTYGVMHGVHDAVVVRPPPGAGRSADAPPAPATLRRDAPGA